MFIHHPEIFQMRSLLHIFQSEVSILNKRVCCAKLMIPCCQRCSLITHRVADGWLQPSRCVLVSHWWMESHYAWWFIVVYCSPCTIYWIHCGHVQPLTGSDGLHERPVVCRLEHNRCVVHGGVGPVPCLLGIKAREKNRPISQHHQSQLKPLLAAFVMKAHVQTGLKCRSDQSDSLDLHLRHKTWAK